MLPESEVTDLPLGQLLMRVARECRHAQVRSLEPFGLSAHQAHAFRVVVRWSGDAGELRLSRLADRLRIAPRSATEVVDALENKGLVRRVPSATDRRATVIALTDAGHDLTAEMRRGDRSGEFFAGLAAAEREELRRLLIKLLDDCG